MITRLLRQEADEVSPGPPLLSLAVPCTFLSFFVLSLSFLIDENLVQAMEKRPAASLTAFIPGEEREGGKGSHTDNGAFAGLVGRGVWYVCVRAS